MLDSTVPVRFFKRLPGAQCRAALLRSSFQHATVKFLGPASVTQDIMATSLPEPDKGMTVCAVERLFGLTELFKSGLGVASFKTVSYTHLDVYKRQISICGKGGVGKTTIAALLSRLIIEQEDLRGLVIDADPGAGLSMALSLPIKKTINDLRESIIAAAKEHAADKLNMAASIDFQLLESLSEYKNLAFLAVGRPEEEGCYLSLIHI